MGCGLSKLPLCWEVVANGADYTNHEFPSPAVYKVLSNDADDTNHKFTPPAVHKVLSNDADDTNHKFTPTAVHKVLSNDADTNHKTSPAVHEVLSNDADDTNHELPSSMHEVLSNDADDTNHELPLSVQEVLSNDDLLMEILVRLPYSHFIFSNRDLDPYEYDFVSLDPRIGSKRSVLFSFNKLKAQVMQSCNGLLLCYTSAGTYSIYNPLISMFKMLPPMHNEYRADDMNMTFDPIISPFYKVVHVGRVKNGNTRIQTYSSETGAWSVWNDDRFSFSCFDGFRDGIYWNGAIHWLNDLKPFHVKLDIVDCPVLTIIQTPPDVAVQGDVHQDRKILKSHSSLLLLCKDYSLPRLLNIYEMKNGNSEWSVKYFVSLDGMMRPHPTWRMPSKWRCHDILSIVLGGRDEDSFMVIKLSGKVLQYNFLLGTVSELFYLGKLIRRFNCFEFIASFAHL